MLEGGAVPECGCKDRQGVEPAPGLIEAFAYKIGGKVPLEVFLLFEGIVVLGVGHRP